MKTIKQIDYYVQIIAILAGIFIIPFVGGLSFFASYFIVGFIQVASFLGHLAAGSKIGLTPGRRKYGWFLLITTIIFLIGIPVSQAVLFLMMIAMLFIAPIIALLYCQMCYNELQLIKHENQQ